MSEEKRQILRMLQEGKISIDEAMKLLDAVDEEKPAPTGTSRSGRMLRVRVEEEGKTKVNVNIPLALAKVALKLIPKSAMRDIEEQNIDLEEIISTVTDTTMGKIVDIVDEDTKVEVFVE
ncbi:MAG TPA: DUF2089 domain-containing protein [Firmicutes bacterium]|nr:DUF2089 domain-containing protein [Bacillota bacterium]